MYERTKDNGHGSRNPWPPGELEPARDEMAESTAIVVGTDLVQVSEVAKAMDRFGERYLHRLFTDAELSYCLESAEVAASRLRRVSPPKKQRSRCCGSPTSHSPGDRSRLRRNPGGWCYLVLHGPMRELAHRSGFVGFSFSITHEGAYAQAVVVGQRRKTLADAPREPESAS